MTVPKKALHPLSVYIFIYALFTILTFTAAPVLAADENIPVYTNTDTGYQVYIFDEAGLLTDDQLSELQTIMQDITIYGNAAFVTIEQNNYSSTKDYISLYYEELFGSSSGTIFLIDMDYRNIWIHSNGAIYKIITNSYADTITDNVYTYASKGDYFSCAAKVFEQELTLLKGQRISQPMKYISNALLAITFALIINYFIVKLYARTSKPSNKELLSGVFSNPAFQNYQLQFTHQTKRYSPQSSDSSSSSGRRSGGGGVRRSSGGRSSGGGVRRSSGGGSRGGGGGHSF